MLSATSLIFLVVLCVLIGGTLLKQWLSHDKSAIWSPLTFICLTLLYYVVLPSTLDLSILGANHNENQFLFYIAACLFYVCVLQHFCLHYYRDSHQGFLFIIRMPNLWNSQLVNGLYSYLLCLLVGAYMSWHISQDQCWEIHFRLLNRFTQKISAIIILCFTLC